MYPENIIKMMARQVKEREVGADAGKVRVEIGLYVCCKTDKGNRIEVKRRLNKIRLWQQMNKRLG